MPDAKLGEQEVATGLTAWAKAVDVQQHFNTLEMQIRSMALTVLTAVIAAGAVVRGQAQSGIDEAMKAGRTPPTLNSVHLGPVSMSAASMIVIGGMIAWCAFYFMDKHWYHRLLLGAVKQAARIEKTMPARYLGVLELTKSIGDESPTELNIYRVFDSPANWVRRKCAEKPKRRGWEIRRRDGRCHLVLHSAGKLTAFYSMVFVVLLLLAFAFSR